MNYHFIGLGGIGMSALARLLLQKGARVQGSDVKDSALLKQLQAEGAKVQIGHSSEAIELGTTVIYSTDIKEENVELERAKALNLPILHRSDLLDQLMRQKKSLLVTGTHGKTTTSALLAFVLHDAGLDPSFVIGGILKSHNVNSRLGQGPFFVAEADESDGSFLKTASFGAIVTNLGNDHLDFWKTPERLEQAFQQFCGQAENLFWCFDDLRLRGLKPKGVGYGFSKDAELLISHSRQKKQGISFDLAFRGKEYREVELSLLGRHNALNGAAVFGLSLDLGIPEAAIRAAFQKFSGTGRRLDWKGETHKVSLYDDYGHHPTEIRATLQALRDHIKEKRMVVLFQPHRYTRVRDLMREFPSSLQEADLVIMTEIFSAGEAPIEGVTTEALMQEMKKTLGEKLVFIPRAHLEERAALLLKPLDVVLTLGAGDITRAGEPLLRLYGERAPKLKVGVLFGGPSAEHPVSLMSARNIVKSLDTSAYEIKLFGVTKEGHWIQGPDSLDLLESKKPIPTGPQKIPGEVLQELSLCDVCFPVFHGPQGEDGMSQGFLDSLSIPYVGCSYQSSALCMQKAWTKSIALLHGIPTAPFIEMDLHSHRKDPTALAKKIDAHLTYPVWVKPVHLGSSIGVSRAATPADLAASAELAFHYDEHIIVEKEMVGRQIEFSLLGNEYVEVALPGEIVSDGEFVAYDKKYGATAMEIRTPAHITEAERKNGSELAEKMYRVCLCKGLARIDFFLDSESHFWLNEINPFPGFTDTSAYPKMCLASGMTLQQVTDDLIALALQRSRRAALVRGKS